MMIDQMLARIPNGSIVRVTWEGGNGPHEYLLRRSPRGMVWFTLAAEPEVFVGWPDEVRSIELVRLAEEVAADAAS